MSQSYGKIVAHLVFSTKNRKPFLQDEAGPRYLAGIVRNFGCECYRAGGIEDHVHLAVRLTRTASAADLVETVKSSPSKWIKHQDASLRSFAWQTGYGIF